MCVDLYANGSVLLNKKQDIDHMEHASLFDEYRQILTKLSLDITQYYSAHDTYLSSFPKEIHKGLFSTQADTENIFRGYFIYIHALTDTLRLSDNTANRLSELILKADRSMQSDLILKCNRAMDKYISYRASVTEYLSQNENEINAKKQNASLSFMLNTATDLKLKTELLLKWLKEDSLSDS